MKYIKTYESFSDKTLQGNILKFELKLDNLIQSGIYKDEKSIDLIKSFDDIKKILLRDCGEFINELKSSGDNLLFRGIKKLRQGPVVEDEKSIDGLYVKTPRKRRYTLDIEPDVSDMFDDHFEQQFGIRLRSKGVFATKDSHEASGYSEYDNTIKGRKAFMFFPIGNYEYFWNPNINDLYSDIEGQRWYYRSWFDEDALYNEWLDSYADPRDYRYVEPNGYYQLFGYDLKGVDESDIVQHIIDSKDKIGLKKNGTCYTKEGRIIICDDSKINNIGDLKWIPDVSFEDWLKENRPEDPYQYVSNIVEGYVRGQLDKVKRQEITFDLDNYYIVDDKYYFLMKEWLFGKT